MCILSTAYTVAFLLEHFSLHKLLFDNSGIFWTRSDVARIPRIVSIPSNNTVTKKWGAGEDQSDEKKNVKVIGAFNCILYRTLQNIFCIFLAIL